MKQYEKKYEDVYSSKLKLKKCNIDMVTTDFGLDAEEYAELMKKNVHMFEKTIFDNLVKYHWLSRRFCYGGTNRERYRRNGYFLDSAFGVFMKHYVNTDKRSFSNNSCYKLTTYFYDFFPDFDVMDPFKEEMVYPYKNIGLSYLYLVYQMDERLELLEYAEKTKIRFTNFLDYIINYINCYNEETGEEKYVWVHQNQPYVRTNSLKKKYEGKKTKTSNI